MIQEPRHKHDCKRCQFIGHVDSVSVSGAHTYDGYICSKTSNQYAGIGSVLLRHGDAPEQYISMPLNMVTHTNGPYNQVLMLALTLEGKVIPKEGIVDASYFQR